MEFEKPEEVAEMQKERTLNDAQLLKEGAEYTVDETGEVLLMPTSEQRDSAQEEMNEAIYEKKTQLEEENNRLRLEKKGLEKRIATLENQLNGIRHIIGSGTGEMPEEGMRNGEDDKSVLYERGVAARSELYQLVISNQNLIEMSSEEFHSKYASGDLTHVRASPKGRLVIGEDSTIYSLEELKKNAERDENTLDLFKRGKKIAIRVDEYVYFVDPESDTP